MISKGLFGNIVLVILFIFFKNTDEKVYKNTCNII